MPLFFITLLLASLSMVGPLAIDASIPGHLAIASDFGISAMLTQQVLSTFLFCFAAAMLIYGTLSDSFGRRPVILASLAVYVLASLGAALADSFAVLLVFRAIEGLAAAAGSVVSRAIVRDRFHGSQAQKVLSYKLMLFGLAPAIAPVLGGHLQAGFGWRAIFAFLAGFGCVVWLASYFSLKESLPPGERHPFAWSVIARNYLRALKHPVLLIQMISASFAFAGIAVYVGSAPQFVMQILGLEVTDFGWMFIPMIGGSIVGAGLAARWASRATEGGLIRFGFAVMGLAVLLNVSYNALSPAALPFAIVPLFLYSFGLAFITPSMALRTLDLLPDLRGLVSSLMAFTQMALFALITGFVVPHLYHDALWIALCHAAVLAVSILLWYRWGVRPASAS